MMIFTTTAKAWLYLLLITYYKEATVVVTDVRIALTIIKMYRSQKEPCF